MNQTRKGTQAVARALGLLKLISQAHPQGIGIAELADAAQLGRATAYRLASSLVEFGLAQRDDSRQYRLGVEAMQLGLASMRSAPIVERLRPVMRRLARRTEDTVFLVVRNGDYGHCLHYEEGPYPVKTLVLQVGGMRVLGVGSAGMTLLATLADDEIEGLYQRHYDEFQSRGLSLSTLKRHVNETRRQGYSNTAGLVANEVSGVGMRFELPTGSQGAISIAAIRSRMQPERKRWIASILADELCADGCAPAAMR